MPSPFPGMDPYLEDQAHWPDFHHEFIGELRRVLGQRLPPNYIARIGEHVYLLDPEDGPVKTVRPDVLLSHDPYSAGGQFTQSATALLEPVTLQNLRPLDPVSEGFIEILYFPDEKVVTVLELLSPTNKNGNGRGQYMEKRELILQRQANLVEFDLLREGQRFGFTKPLPPGQYYTFVSRWQRRGESDVYAWTMRQPLPVLPIPLQTPDPDIHINLAEIFTAAYDRGPYARTVKYSGEPPGPMSPQDAQWARDVASIGAGKPA